MFGKIKYITEGEAHVESKIEPGQDVDLMNSNVVFEAPNQEILGEVEEVNDDTIKIRFLGEFINGKYVSGVIRKPLLSSNIRMINKEELQELMGTYNDKTFKLGQSAIYKDYTVCVNINDLLSNHMAIFGNSGSGKSCGVSRIVQNLFSNPNFIAYNANIFIFDAYGEYQPAFFNIGKNNPNLNYKVITTDLNSTEFPHLCLPFWLLSVDDIALLLNANNENQIPIIEKALKLVGYFTKKEEEVIDQKNDILARSILDIIFSGKNPSEIRNKLISVLTQFKTKDINLEITLTKGGWSRTIRQCLFVEPSGKFADIEVVIQYLEGFTQNNFQLTLPDGTFMYGLKEFSLALEFALISEGVLTSEKVFDYANSLKIRLNTLINSDYANFFNYPNFVTVEGYIKDLLVTSEGRKAQIVNFNINYVDDRFAKNLVKIYSKLLFDYVAKLKNRGSIAFHILLEEAHRYVQDDIDIKLFGYNIFERIAKEGRKYGILLGMISQRPSELSETAISQCSNFLVFKMFHPNDIAFVTSILPNISSNLMNKLKTYHSGTCIAYGSAFRMPVVVNVDQPDPSPLSQNVDISKVWYVKQP